MKQALLFLAALSMLPGAFAQQSTDPVTTATLGRSTGSRQPGGGIPNIDETARVLLLSGRLVMADGTPLPHTAQVDLSCNGRLVRQANSSKDGNFTIDLGSGRQFGTGMSDASSSDFGGAAIGSTTFGTGFGGTTGRRASLQSRGRVDLSGCELLVRSIPGYRSESPQLGTVGEFEGNIGTIYVVPIGGSQGGTVSAKTLKAPQPAVRELEKARKELARKSANLQKAETALRKAIKTYPDFAEAWSLLGDVRAAQHDPAQAREAYRKAMEIDPRYARPCLGLTRLEVEESHWKEARALSDRLVELSPQAPQSRYYHAVCHFQTGDIPGAEESIRVLESAFRGMKLPPLVHYLKGAIFAMRKDFTAAAQEFNRFLESPLAQSAAVLVARTREALADWEKRGLVSSAQSVSGPQ